MSKVIISPVGASLLFKDYFPAEAKQELLQVPKEGTDAITKMVSRDFKILFDTIKTSTSNKQPAEVASLDLILSPVKDELLVFISTDTPDGLYCALFLQKYYLSLGFKNVEVKKISGLQISDADLLLNSGLNRLQNVLDHIFAENHPSEIYINITAGYKATLTFLSLYASARQCTLIYAFESKDPVLIKMKFEVTHKIKISRLRRNEDGIILEDDYPEYEI